jgi:hypothetical protein
MADITKAADALRNKRLNQLVRTTEFGVITWREYVERRIRAGGTVRTAEVSDYALRAKLEAEYEFMNRGFNVPWGNECHPTTIKAQALKDRLKGQITSTEYRLSGSVPDHWTVINKTVYEYGLNLMKTAEV